jgi:FtsZ-interacting cell division protein ZipA
MNKGAKIAVGCGIAVVAVVIVAIVAAVGVGYWGSQKLKSAGFDPAKMRQFAELQKKADAIPFSTPADGVIPEERFVRFLAVRKAIFPIYEQHHAEFERLKEKKKDAGVSDVMSLGGVIASIQYARAEAMDAQGMGTAEYTWIAEAATQAHIAAQVAASASQAGSEPPSALLELPQANLALFQKYKDDIEQYAMPELAAMGM